MNIIYIFTLIFCFYILFSVTPLALPFGQLERYYARSGLNKEIINGTSIAGTVFANIDNNTEYNVRTEDPGIGWIL